MLKSANFNELSVAHMRYKSAPEIEAATRHAKSANLVAKAAVAAADWSAAWGSAAGQGVAVEFLTTIRDASIFDTVARFATILPVHTLATRVSAGASASVTGGGEAVAATRVEVAGDDLTREKVAAIVVMSDELARTRQAFSIVQRELGNAVIAGTNKAFLAGLTQTSATAGSTALESLRAGLDALGDCQQVVVAAPHSTVRELALQADGRVALTGGEYLPGIHVVAADVTAMFVVAADRCVMENPSQLAVTRATDATAMLSDDPEHDSGQVVSLFQTHMTGVRVLRSLAFAGEVVKVS